MSPWREAARVRIMELTKDLPERATVAERRKALRGKGWPAHQGTSWGRKMWGKEVQAYLRRHDEGLAKPIRHNGFEFPEHVHFPFREER